MEFKDILVLEYFRFWKAVGDNLLLENGFFDDFKFADHFRRHVFHPKNDAEKYDYNKLYQVSINDIQRYVFPNTMTPAEYVDRANKLMNDTTDPSIVGFVDFYFTKVLQNRDMYIKQRPCDYQVVNKYANVGRNRQKNLIPIPHDEYVAYQINENGERKIVSYGLVHKPHWSAVIRTDFNDGVPIKELPESELKKDRTRTSAVMKPVQKLPAVKIWYIDTAERKVQSTTMPKNLAIDLYSDQWLDNAKKKCDKLVFKIEGYLEYPPKPKKKKEYWVEQENKYDVDLSGECVEKVLQALVAHRVEPSDDIINKFIKVYTMRKLRNATPEKIEKNYQTVMLGVDDFDNMWRIQDDISEGYFRMTGSRYLTEANRQQLLNKSRSARQYKDTSKGRTRYERRMKSQISATVKDYNNIEMDALFKRDVFEMKIPVIGETDVYEVHIKVDGVINEIHRQVQTNKGKLEFKVVLQSLMRAINLGDVYIGCTCPDFRYRQRFWATQGNYVAGGKETRPSNKTNPHDDLGAACKHGLLILSNLDWCIKVASVINNYIKYCQTHLEQAYADYIFPKIYGIKYDKAVQMNLFYNGFLPQDKATRDEITRQSLQGRDKQGKFSQDNRYKFKKSETQTYPEDNPDQLKLNLDSPDKVFDADAEAQLPGEGSAQSPIAKLTDI